MYCKNCGNTVADGLTHCDVCGAELTSEVANYTEANVDTALAVDPGKTLGIVSMVMGIVGFACCNPFGLVGLVGLILGIIANKKSKAAGYKNTFALVGIIICAIVIALGVISAISLIFIYGTSFIATMAGAASGY